MRRLVYDQCWIEQLWLGSFSYQRTETYIQCSIAINDIYPNVENLVYLVKYDSIHGYFSGQVEESNSDMHISVDDCCVQ
jgi:glyceraldehyde-3-phosphate dehydrogenase/erythrose-4-phosphate dehydrogenase